MILGRPDFRYVWDSRNGCLKLTKQSVRLLGGAA